MMTFAGTVLVAEKFIFSASCNQERYQLFQLQFHKKDGSIFLHFPYQPDNASFLNKISLKAGLNYPHNINVKSGGKITGHKIKFSHHPDGRSHFSQDNKINTQIINYAASLTSHNGHLFTLHLGGIRTFNKIPLEEENKCNKKSYFDIKMSEPSNLKFVGFWYSDSHLRQYLKEYDLEGGPEAIFTRKNDSGLKAVMIENIYIQGTENYYLFLGFELDAKLSNKNEPSILFVGGFEQPAISLNHNMDTSFLIWAYPANENYLSLVKEIGTVDREPPLF